jgi:hypothetical protein
MGHPRSRWAYEGEDMFLEPVMVADCEDYPQLHSRLPRLLCLKPTGNMIPMSRCGNMCTIFWAHPCERPALDCKLSTYAVVISVD